MKKITIIKEQLGLKILSEAEQKEIKGGEIAYPTGSVCHKLNEAKCGGECIDKDGYLSTCSWSLRKEECICPPKA